MVLKTTNAQRHNSGSACTASSDLMCASKASSLCTASLRTMNGVVGRSSPFVPRVVCCKKSILRARGFRDFEDWATRPGHLYIGKDMSLFVKGAFASRWRNPFRVGDDDNCDTIGDVLRQYEDYVRGNSELASKLSDLIGLKEIGCWCAPGPCHGDVLVKLLQQHCCSRLNSTELMSIHNCCESKVHRHMPSRLDVLRDRCTSAVEEAADGSEVPMSSDGPFDNEDPSKEVSRDRSQTISFACCGRYVHLTSMSAPTSVVTAEDLPLCNIDNRDGTFCCRPTSIGRRIER